MGLPWDHPLAYTREFIDGLLPLLAGELADVDGTQVTTHAELNITAPDTPILLAALGPKMLELAGRTVAGHDGRPVRAAHHRHAHRAAIMAAAAEAGRPAPRIMALIRLCVTDDVAQARYAARQGDGDALPRRAVVRARCRTWRVSTTPPSCTSSAAGSGSSTGSPAYAEAGVTDYRLEIAAPTLASRDATREAFATYLAG